MIIDFHTHIFPDKLAPRAMKALTEEIDNLYPPVHDSTLTGLLANMDACGVDTSVIQPVITKQSQTKTTNEWAASLSSERIIPFGGIYPHTDDYKGDMGFAYYPQEQFLRIVSKHGADKILFATDSPWSDPSHEIAKLDNMPLSEEDKASIFFGNAKRILGI